MHSATPSQPAESAAAYIAARRQPQVIQAAPERRTKWLPMLLGALLTLTVAVLVVGYVVWQDTLSQSAAASAPAPAVSTENSSPAPQPVAANEQAPTNGAPPAQPAEPEPQAPAPPADEAAYLNALVDEVIANNPDLVNAYLAGKKTAVYDLVADVIKRSAGKADLDVAHSLLIQKLEAKRQ
jgi:hypothetical protein